MQPLNLAEDLKLGLEINMCRDRVPKICKNAKNCFKTFRNCKDSCGFCGQISQSENRVLNNYISPYMRCNSILKVEGTKTTITPVFFRLKIPVYFFKKRIKKLRHNNKIGAVNSVILPPYPVVYQYHFFTIYY